MKMSTIWNRLKTAKACSYCASRPTIAIVPWPLDSDEYLWTVQCTHCGSHGPNLPTQHEALDAWESGKWEHSETWDRLAESARNKSQEIIG